MTRLNTHLWMPVFFPTMQYKDGVACGSVLAQKGRQVHWLFQTRNQLAKCEHCVVPDDATVETAPCLEVEPYRSDGHTCLCTVGRVEDDVLAREFTEDEEVYVECLSPLRASDEDWVRQNAFEFEHVRGDRALEGQTAGLLVVLQFLKVDANMGGAGRRGERHVQ